MNLTSDNLVKQYARENSGRLSGGTDVFEPTIAHNYDTEAKQQAELVEWINTILPNINFPVKASTEDLRASLIDGTVLIRILNRLRPGSVKEGGDSAENVRKFLESMDELGVPKFEISDLEKGSMKMVMDCLLTLRSQFFPMGDNFCPIKTTNRIGSPRAEASSPTAEERRKLSFNNRSPIMSDPSAALMHHVGHKFHEVFQLKQGRYADLSAAKISEMMKSNSLDNAPTQSLLSVVNGILDESIERKNGEIPHRVACLLRKVVQEIERRISTQAEHLRTQNNLFKAREEKYQSRIRVLEALASGTGEDTGIAPIHLQQIQIDKPKMEEKKKVDGKEAVELIKEKEQAKLELSALKQELETAKKMHEMRYSQIETEAKGCKADLERRSKELEHLLEDSRNKVRTLEAETKGDKAGLEGRLIEVQQLLEDSRNKVRTLEAETEGDKVSLERRSKELEQLLEDSRNKVRTLEEETKGDKASLEGRLKEFQQLLEDSKNKVKVLEATSEFTNQRWSKKQQIFQSVMEFQFGALQELRLSSKFIEHEIVRTQESYSEEFDRLGITLKTVIDATENYHLVLAENRRMFNELQDLKGNIRVFCRVRPFLPGQAAKKTTVDHIGENGELVVVNPSKPGKDAQKMFRFNKVYGPDSTQAEVFSDTQPLIRSVLDGYNVCIFAYGQTGSGKTYTMTGPNGATDEELGVNYRALNDLFNISQNRKGCFVYEVGVQIVEIYNEQVRDLLTSDGAQKKLGILSATQSNGVAVPDASMLPVTSTSDVIHLMDTGFKNRAMGATALNERSSRSHSVVSIHVRGKDLQNGASLHGNLHLVDLAGSERVDRSEVTGDRLKEAQHINKSLSALGDVIFALAQKSSHVPYRNSKLTQLLQSSLGGQAKTLMFVQLNPDETSYSETLSTLKFAERVSGVELGAARSSKEGRDVKELMEQVASLKDTITKKDGEIERLQLLKDLKNVYPGLNGEKQATGSLRYGVTSPTRSVDSIGGTQKSPARKGGHSEKAASDQDNCSDHSDKHSEGEILGYGDGDYEERLSDMSDSAISAGTEHDGSADEGSKTPARMVKSKVVSKVRNLQKLGKTITSTVSASRDSLRGSTAALPGLKKTASNSTLIKPTKRWA